jgi:hypothetical protein
LLLPAQIAILKECRNVHVVQFLGACMHPGCTMLITELMAANAQDLIHSGQLGWRDKCAHCAAPPTRHARNRSAGFALRTLTHPPFALLCTSSCRDAPLHALVP